MRFSILTLLGLVAVAALVTAALVEPTREIYGGLLPAFTVGCVLAGICGAIILTGGSRSFCIGFAVFGIGYVIFATFLREVVSPGAASSYLYDLWRPWGKKSLSNEEILRVNKVLRAIVVFTFSTIGGCTARYFYSLRQKQNAQAGGIAKHSPDGESGA